MECLWVWANTISNKAKSNKEITVHSSTYYFYIIAGLKTRWLNPVYGPNIVFSYCDIFLHDDIDIDVQIKLFAKYHIFIAFLYEWPWTLTTLRHVSGGKYFCRR